MAACWTAEELKFDSRQRQEISLFTKASKLAVPRPIQTVPETVSAWLKRDGLEANHSPPSNAEVKYGGGIPLLPRIRLLGVVIN
jgi:hypothetical protein